MFEVFGILSFGHPIDTENESHFWAEIHIAHFVHVVRGDCQITKPSQSRRKLTNACTFLQADRSWGTKDVDIVYLLFCTLLGRALCADDLRVLVAHLVELPLFHRCIAARRRSLFSR